MALLKLDNLILFHQQFDQSMKNLNSMIYAMNVRCVHVVLNKVAKLDIFLDTLRMKIFFSFRITHHKVSASWQETTKDRLLLEIDRDKV